MELWSMHWVTGCTLTNIHLQEEAEKKNEDGNFQKEAKPEKRGFSDGKTSNLSAPSREKWIGKAVSYRSWWMIELTPPPIVFLSPSFSTHILTPSAYLFASSEQRGTRKERWWMKWKVMQGRSSIRALNVCVSLQYSWKPMFGFSRCDIFANWHNSNLFTLLNCSASLMTRWERAVTKSCQMPEYQRVH